MTERSAGRSEGQWMITQLGAHARQPNRYLQPGPL
jgi:hypothetical protein